jgi:hypothetical protein
VPLFTVSIIVLAMVFFAFRRFRPFEIALFSVVISIVLVGLAGALTGAQKAICFSEAQGIEVLFALPRKICKPSPE